MRSWKTTAAGCLSAAASFVLFAHNSHYAVFPGWMIGVATFAQVGGLASLGIAAKDYNVSGKNAPPSEDKATK